MAATPAFAARRARPAAAGVAALLAALALAACGDSKEEKAQQSVCDARADISKEVDKLKGLNACSDAVANCCSAAVSWLLASPLPPLVATCLTIACTWLESALVALCTCWRRCRWMP